MQNLVPSYFWDSMLKVCPKHGITEYSGEKRKRCKKCNVEAVTNRRKAMKKKAVEYKGGCCQKCGYDRCVGALEFHHQDPNAKEFSIGGSRQTAAWEKIKTELDKCILICANCHREIHEQMDRCSEWSMGSGS